MTDSEKDAVPASPAATLYVGDLHSDVTDSQLYKAFSEFNTLISARVCKDSATGKSLCYGFVNLSSHQEAIRAIELKNHSSLNGKVIRVMWLSRDAGAGKSGKGNVFVKNLAESIDNVGLHDLFQKYGNILSSKIVMSEDGKSKGVGYLQFDSEESANVAIQKMNGSTVRDKQIYVGKFIRKSERSLPDPDAKYTNLYVKNLDPGVTEKHLEEKFSSYGKIVSLAIKKNENGLSKGFGFVNYDSPDDARQAMEAMDGSQFGSKILYVARAQKKVEREQILHHLFVEKGLKHTGSNIYVKNIDTSVGDEELRDHFSACGTVLSAKVMQDDKGASKGFGFVCFSTVMQACKSVSCFNGCMFHGKPLYVAFAQKKEDRERELQIRHAQKKLEGLAGPSSTSGACPPPFIYKASGVAYHPPMGSGWSANGFASPSIISNLAKPQMIIMGGTKDNTNSKESITYSGQAKYVASGCQQNMQEKPGFSAGYARKSWNFTTHTTAFLLIVILFAFIAGSNAEINKMTLRSDSRRMIFIETFGFTESGRVEIGVSHVAVSGVAEPPPNRFGFLLVDQYSFEHLLKKIENDTGFCALDWNYATVLFTFHRLSGSTFSYFHTFPINLPQQYNLLFFNCVPTSRVSLSLVSKCFNVNANQLRNYVSVGKTELVVVFLVFGILYSLFTVCWLFITLHFFRIKIYLVMTGIPLSAAFHLFCAAKVKYNLTHLGTVSMGWHLILYSVIALRCFSVLVVIFLGWSFVKNFLQRRRHQRIFSSTICIQVCSNLVSIVVEMICADHIWITLVFALVDIMCGCVIVFTTQNCLRFHKKVADSRDGNNKALGYFKKLKIFKNFYVILVLYLVFIRVLYFVLNNITKYRFRWVSSVTHEMITIIFYLVVFYIFVPNDEKNLYFLIEEEAEQSVAGTELEERVL